MQHAATAPIADFKVEKVASQDLIVPMNENDRQEAAADNQQELQQHESTDDKGDLQQPQTRKDAAGVDGPVLAARVMPEFDDGIAPSIKVCPICIEETDLHVECFAIPASCLMQTLKNIKHGALPASRKDSMVYTFCKHILFASKKNHLVVGASNKTGQPMKLQHHVMQIRHADSALVTYMADKPSLVNQFLLVTCRGPRRKLPTPLPDLDQPEARSGALPLICLLIQPPLKVSLQPNAHCMHALPFLFSCQVHTIQCLVSF